MSDDKLGLRFDLPHITEFGYLTLVRLRASAAVRASGARATTSQWLPASLFWLQWEHGGKIHLGKTFDPRPASAAISAGLSPTQQRPQQQMTVGGRNLKQTSSRQPHTSVRSRKAISQADRSPFAKVALFTSGPTRLTLPGGGSELTIVFEFFPKKHQLQNRTDFL